MKLSGAKTLIIASAIVYFAVALVGHFYGLPHSHINALDFLKVKLVDANLGHLLGVIVFCYLLFGKQTL